jgi:hypothetical protein
MAACSRARCRQRSAGGAVQKGVELGAGAVDYELSGARARGRSRELGLRPQHVGLRDAAGGVAILGDAGKALQDLRLAGVDQQLLVCFPQVKVGALDPGDGVEGRAIGVASRDIGVVFGHFGGQPPLARKRKLL